MTLPDLSAPTIAIPFLLVFCVYGCAIWKLIARSRGADGGEPELCGAAVLLLTVAIQAAFYSKANPIFSNVDLVSLLIDSILVLGFTAIALNANRVWPLIAAGVQMVGLFSHFSRAVQLEIAPLAYAILKGMPTAVVIICVLIGFIGHFRRMKRFKYDQDWMDWTHNQGLGPSRG